MIRTVRRFWMVAALLLATATLLALPVATAVPQDMDADDVFPDTRRARVSSMMSTNGSPIGVKNGGYRVHLSFEDNLDPAEMVLWVDEKQWQRTATGDLFIARYRPDGTLIDVVGPIRE